MATIVTRSGKGSPLTNNEVDANFTNLNTDKLEVGGGTLTGALTISSGGLTVNSGTVNLNTTFQSTDDIVQINFTDDDTTNSITSSGVGFRFLSAGSEKARLTNSANLLIGESGGSISNSSSATGINLKPNSSSAFSRNGGTTLFLNRLNTDGDILVFRNSGSTVGSIASRSGAVTTMIFDPRANGSGISGTTNGIIPTNQSGTPTNNHVDLGSTTNKFKDLHLSGTVNAESGTFGSLTVDDISINGSTISDSGNLTLDVGGDISLDADGGNIKLSDGGTEVGRFLLNDSNHLKLKSIQSNADIKFQGNDDGTGITALTLDMSDAGTAIFNHDIKLGDNSKAIFGAGNDLQIYHDGANSYVSDQGVGALRILTNGLQVKNAADTENIIVGNQNGAVTLYHNGSPKLATTSTGISISNDANFPDNGKAIFGASDDLQIYHDGSNSYISEVGAGSLKIQSTSGLALQDSSGNNFAVFTDEGTGGKVELYKSSTVRLTTTTSGIDVTGRIQTTAAAGNHTVFNSTGADADFRVRTGADTHSFYVEGNTGNIGLGTSSPNGNGSRTTLHINSDTNGSAIRLSQSSNSSLIRYSDSAGLEIGTIASKTLKLETNDTTALTIDTSQNSTFAGTISSGAITSTGLTVNAAQSNFNDSAGAVIAFQKSSSAKAWIANRSYGFHDGNGLAINTTDANPIRFGTNNSEVARLTSSGHLGIGTTTVGTLHGASYGTTQLHIDGKTDRGQMIIEGDTLSLIAMSDNSATANSRVFLSMVNDGLMEFRSVNDDGTSKATIMSMTSAGATTFSDNVSLLDDKLLMFGTGSDARLKFDSSTNALMITATNGTADNIRTQSNNLSLEQANGGKYISATANDSVKLYHADTPVVKTTAGGLVVESGMNFNMTGSMMIGATTAPDTALHVKTSADTIIKVEKTDGNYIQLHGTGAGGRIKSDGQINFDVGSNSGALNLASNGNATFLGSVTSTGLTASTSGNQTLLIDSTGGVSSIQFRTGSGSISNYIRSGLGGSAVLQFMTGGENERMRLDSSGRLLIAATSTSFSDKFYINNSAYSTGGWRVGTGSTFVGKTYNDLGVMTFETDSTRSMKFVGGTVGEIMRIDGVNARVGIGTTSPDVLLDVEGSGSTPLFLSRKQSSVGPGVGLGFRQYDSANNLHSYASIFGVIEDNTNGAEDGGLVFHTSLASALGERMRITSSGNVGIGVTNPAVPLDIQSNSSAEGIRVRGRSSDNIGQITLTDSGGTARNQIQGSATYLNIKTFPSSPIVFFTGGSERMRIDSSGNFMVGKTTQGLSNAGFEVAQTGQASATQSGASCLRLNRLTSDGEILQFRKAGVTVGNIATVDGDLTIFSSASGHKGLRFGNGYIAPTANSTNIEDNAVDLGLTIARFKDLHLSNSVKNSSGALAVESGGGGQLLLKASSELTFSTNSAERMRINSSGNLLVGKTATTFATQGAVINHNGTIDATRSGEAALFLNRLSSDGNIASFYKNSVAVGNIGTGNSGNLYIGSGDAGINFNKDVNSVYPINVNTGGATDGTLDIGLSAYRFKDLHLSGSISSGAITASGNSTFQGSTTTIGNAASNINVELNLNGVASKAQRIQFQENGVNKWLLGQGAASETSAFELYNASGVIALSVNKTTNAATFSSSVTSTGLTVSTTYPKLQLNDTQGVARNFSLGTNNETFTIRNETASSDSLTISNANIVNIPQSLMVGATTAPSTKLEIKSSGSDDGIQIIKSDNTNILGSLIQTGSGDGALTLRNAGNSQTVLFRGQGNNYITGGNFGLGTSSPDATLRIDNESGTALKVTGGAGGTSIASFVRDVGANVSINVHGDSARPQISLASVANTFSMGVIGSSFEIADSDALGSNTRLSIDSSGRLGLGTSSPTAPLHIATSGTGDTLLLESTDAGTGNAPNLTLWRNSSSPADGDAIGRIKFNAEDDTGTATVFAQIDSEISDASNNTENGILNFRTVADGTFATRLAINTQGAVTATSKLGVGGNASPNSVLAVNGSSGITNNAGIFAVGTDTTMGTGTNMLVMGVVDDQYGWIEAVKPGFDRRKLVFQPNGISSSSGFVGIGDTDPQKVLHLKSSGATGIAIESTTNAQNLDIDYYNNANSVAGRIRYAEGTGNFEFMPNQASTAMQITYGGNVLIGKTADNDTSAGIRFQSNGSGSFVRDNNNVLTVDRRNGDGNLIEFRKSTVIKGAIGTDATHPDGSEYTGATLYIGAGDAGFGFSDSGDLIYPYDVDSNIPKDNTITLGHASYRFKDAHFSGTVNSNGLASTGAITSSNGTLGAPAFRPTADINTGMYFPQANVLALVTDGNEAFRINQFGTVMVGSSQPFRNFSVSFNSTETNTSSTSSGFGNTSNVGTGLMINNTNTTNNTYAPLDFKCGTNNVYGRIAYKATDFSDEFGQFEFITMDDGSAVNALTIASSGNGTFAGSCTATSFPTSSDARLKDNIEDADDSGTAIDSLLVRQFDWKSNGKHEDYGMIAQEVIHTCPNAVSVPQEDGEMMGIDYSKMVPLLLKEIQELRKRVKKLEE